MWPCLLLSDWLRAGFEEPFGGHFFLGGYRMVDEMESIKQMFSEFWARYKFHSATPPPDPERTIPVYLHGDEGRGQVKRPVKVISYQPCIKAKTKKNLLPIMFCFISRFCDLIMGL